MSASLDLVCVIRWHLKSSWHQGNDEPVVFLDQGGSREGIIVKGRKHDNGRCSTHTERGDGQKWKHFFFFSIFCLLPFHPSSCCCWCYISFAVSSVVWRCCFVVVVVALLLLLLFFYFFFFVFLPSFLPSFLSFFRPFSSSSVTYSTQIICLISQYVLTNTFSGIAGNVRGMSGYATHAAIQGKPENKRKLGLLVSA